MDFPLGQCHQNHEENRNIEKQRYRKTGSRGYAWSNDRNIWAVYFESGLSPFIFKSRYLRVCVSMNLKIYV